MGSSKSGKRKATPAAPLKPMPAQGRGGKKRTPQSAFDPAAGKDIYEPERIVAERLAKGVTQFHVKWVNWEPKHNTWEPIENLAGCEDLIADFKERKKQKDAELEAAAQSRKAEQQEAAAAEAAKMAAAAAAARVAKHLAGAAGANAPTCSPAAAQGTDNPECLPCDSDTKKPGFAPGTRRTAPIWTAFSEEGCPEGYASCTLLKACGQVCGAMIAKSGGPSGLWNHALYHHKADYARLKPASAPLDLSDETFAQTKLPAVSDKVRDTLHKATARWLCKRKRSLRLPEDIEYRELWKLAMHGSYTPPDEKTVLSHVVLLGAEGKQKLFDVNTALLGRGIKPAVAGDIWSSHGVSLFGMTQYHITDDWEICELLLASSPFSKNRHTAEAIDDKTREACIAAGLPHDVYSGVFFPVSDNGANMVKGWEGFGRGPCCVHTGQLSVKVSARALLCFCPPAHARRPRPPSARPPSSPLSLGLSRTLGDQAHPRQGARHNRALLSLDGRRRPRCAQDLSGEVPAPAALSGQGQRYTLELGA